MRCKVLMALLFMPLLAQSAELPSYALVIRENRFEPSSLVIPAGQKVKLVVTNQDASPEEFESHELNREKVIPGNSSATIYVGPLKPGRYPFFGEFHPNTAQGTLIAQ
ncbi:MAG TPA: cupredoxin domain-containing protein [Nevskiales bacterium]|nr:cupredoxin domain-containing protein [Nevskiales bacterium]